MILSVFTWILWVFFTFDSWKRSQLADLPGAGIIFLDLKKGKANGIPSQVTDELSVSVVLKGINGGFSPAVEMKGRYKEDIYHAFDIIISIIMGKIKQNLYRNPAYFFLSVASD